MTGVLELSQGLSPRALSALRSLQERTVAADGGRLKLEWPTLAARTGDRVEDVLWWDGEDLVGFLGIYAFGEPDVELAGMVDPNHRRRGIGTALLDAARVLCRERDHLRTLLVTPRTTPAGSAFALAHGGVLEHSEHALVLTGEPADGPTDPSITMRRADRSDGVTVADLMRAAFGWSPPDAADRLHSANAQTLMIERAGAVVGTVRISLDRDGGGADGDLHAGVYGFAVDPAWQGRGIGRDALRRVCRRLRADGATRIGLEVAVDNPHALGLYTSLGFEPVATEDYFHLPR